MSDINANIQDLYLNWKKQQTLNKASATSASGSGVNSEEDINITILKLYTILSGKTGNASEILKIADEGAKSATAKSNEYLISTNELMTSYSKYAADTEEGKFIRLFYDGEKATELYNSLLKNSASRFLNCISFADLVDGLEISRTNINNSSLSYFSVQQKLAELTQTKINEESKIAEAEEMNILSQEDNFDFNNDSKYDLNDFLKVMKGIDVNQDGKIDQEEKDFIDTYKNMIAAKISYYIEEDGISEEELNNFNQAIQDLPQETLEENSYLISELQNVANEYITEQIEPEETTDDMASNNTNANTSIKDGYCKEDGIRYSNGTPLDGLYENLMYQDGMLYDGDLINQEDPYKTIISTYYLGKITNTQTIIKGDNGLITQTEDCTYDRNGRLTEKNTRFLDEQGNITSTSFQDNFVYDSDYAQNPVSYHENTENGAFNIHDIVYDKNNQMISYKQTNEDTNIETSFVIKDGVSQLATNTPDTTDNTTLFDEFGFDANGINKDTQTQYDIHGFNKDGINKDTNSNTDNYGFDITGFNHWTESNYDFYGFNIDGINKDSQTEYDLSGFNRDGINEDTHDYYDIQNYDRNGISPDGWTRDNIFLANGTLYNPDGWSRDGINEETKTIYDKHGFTQQGTYKDTGRYEDYNGFDRYGYNTYTQSDYDYRGFDFNGINKDTQTIYDKEGWTQNGDLNQKTGTEYDENDWSFYGINKRTGQMEDERRFMKSGLNVNTGTYYDLENYDINGYDPNGYDKYGFNKDGYDIDGIKKQNVPDGKYSNKNDILTQDDTNGLLYINGRTATGKYSYDNETNTYIKDDENGIMYDEGMVVSGIYEDKIYENGFTVSGIRNNTLYKDGVIDTAEQYYRGQETNWTDLRFKDGTALTGWGNDGYYYEEGIQTYKTIDGLGEDGYYYYFDSLVTGYSNTTNNIYYVNGKPANGLYNNILYKDGLPCYEYDCYEIPIEGVEYNPADETTYTKQYFIMGEPANSIINGILYKDGFCANGIIDGLTYKDGKLLDDADNYIQEGVRYDSSWNALSQTLDGILYENGIAKTGAVQNEDGSYSFYTNGVIDNTVTFTQENDTFTKTITLPNGSVISAKGDDFSAVDKFNINSDFTGINLSVPSDYNSKSLNIEISEFSGGTINLKSTFNSVINYARDITLNCSTEKDFIINNGFNVEINTARKGATIISSVPEPFINIEGESTLLAPNGGAIEKLPYITLENLDWDDSLFAAQPVKNEDGTYSIFNNDKSKEYRFSENYVSIIQKGNETAKYNTKTGDLEFFTVLSFNEDGSIKDGIYKGVLYKDSKAFTGVQDNVYYKNGYKYYKEKIVAGVLYNNSVPVDGLYTDGKLYAAGKTVTGDVNGTYYENGTVLSGTSKDNGLFYQNGQIYTGILDSTVFVNGEKINGNYIVDTSSTPATIVQNENGLMYKDGIVANNITIDDKLYENGTIAKGYDFYESTQTMYFDGIKYTGIFNTLAYNNGELLTGELDGKIYKNGNIINGYCIVTKDSDGNISDIELTNNPENADFYSFGKIADKIVIGDTYYEQGKVAVGKVAFNNSLYEDGHLATGDDLVDNIMYRNGKKLTGKSDDKYYFEGSALTGHYTVNTNDNGDVTSISKNNNGIMYNNGIIADNVDVDGSYYINGSLAGTCSADGKIYIEGLGITGQYVLIEKSDIDSIKNMQSVDGKITISDENSDTTTTYYIITQNGTEYVVLEDYENGKMYYKGDIANNVAVWGKYYKNGEIGGTGVFENMFYQNGKLGTGVYNDIAYMNGQPLNGYFNVTELGTITETTINGVMYQDGVVADNVIIDNKLYINGQAVDSGVCDDKYFVNGELATGYNTVNETLYYEGRTFTGISDGKYYVDGVVANGECNGAMYNDGTLFTGTINNVQYLDGFIADEEEVDGIMYKDGVPANCEIFCTIYKNGLPLTGLIDGYMYKDGYIADDAVVDDMYYKEGLPAAGVDSDGIIYGNDGKKINDTIDGILYLNGKPYTGQNNEGLMLYNGETANNVVIDGVLYQNGLKSTGYATLNGIKYYNALPLNGENEGLMYSQGKPANGTFNNLYYINGTEAQKPQATEYINSDGLYIISFPDISSLDVSEDNISISENSDGSSVKTLEITSQDGLHCRTITLNYDENYNLTETSIDDYITDEQTGNISYYSSTFDANQICTNRTVANYTDTKDVSEVSGTNANTKIGGVNGAEDTSETSNVDGVNPQNDTTAQLSDNVKKIAIEYHTSTLKTLLSSIQFKYGEGDTYSLNNDDYFSIVDNTSTFDLPGLLDYIQDLGLSFPSFSTGDVTYEKDKITCKCNETTFELFIDENNQITKFVDTWKSEEKDENGKVTRNIEETKTVNISYDSNGNIKMLSCDEITGSSNSNYSFIIKDGIIQHLDYTKHEDIDNEIGKGTACTRLSVNEEMNVTNYEYIANTISEDDHGKYSRDKVITLDTSSKQLTEVETSWSKNDTEETTTENTYVYSVSTNLLRCYSYTTDTPPISESIDDLPLSIGSGSGEATGKYRYVYPNEILLTYIHEVTTEKDEGYFQSLDVEDLQEDGTWLKTGWTISSTETDISSSYKEMHYESNGIDTCTITKEDKHSDENGTTTSSSTEKQSYDGEKTTINKTSKLNYNSTQEGVNSYSNNDNSTYTLLDGNYLDHFRPKEENVYVQQIGTANLVNSIVTGIETPDADILKQNASEREAKAVNIVITNFLQSIAETNESVQSLVNTRGWLRSLIDTTYEAWGGDSSLKDILTKENKELDTLAKLINAASNKDINLFKTIYKEITGVKFNTENILAAPSALNYVIQTQAAINTSQKLYEALNEEIRLVEYDAMGLPVASTSMTLYEAALNIWNKTQTTEPIIQKDLDDIKNAYCNALAKARGCSAEDIAREVEGSYKDMYGKDYGSASLQEKAKFYSALLISATDKKYLDNLKSSIQAQKRALHTYKAKNYARLEALTITGNQSLEQMIEKNVKIVETSYAFTKVGVTMIATILTGGIATAVGATATALQVITACAVTGITNLTIEEIEESTDADGYTWKDAKTALGDAALASLFTVLGMGANNAGNVAKTLTYATNNCPKVLSRLLGAVTELSTDVSLSMSASAIFGQDAGTVDEQAFQSLVGQLIGYALGGGFAIKASKVGAEINKFDLSSLKGLSQKQIANKFKAFIKEELSIGLEKLYLANPTGAKLSNEDISTILNTDINDLESIFKISQNIPKQTINMYDLAEHMDYQVPVQTFILKNLKTKQQVELLATLYKNLNWEGQNIMNIVYYLKNYSAQMQELVDMGLINAIKEGKISSEIFKNLDKDIRLADSTVLGIKNILTNQPTLKTQANAQIGDAYELNGKLYVKNATGNDTELQLSKTKFEELFPSLIKLNQSTLSDCWLISELQGLMNTANGRAKIYSWFKQDGNDILVSIPGFETIRFKDGIVLDVGKKQIQGNQTGLKMIEQAIAINKWNMAKSDNITTADSTLLNASSIMQLLGPKDKGSSTKSVFEIANKLKKAVATNEYTVKKEEQLETAVIESLKENTVVIVTTCSGWGTGLSGVEVLVKYNLINRTGGTAHFSVITGYNPSTKTVYLQDPLLSSNIIEMSLDDLQKITKRVNVQYIN